LSNPEKNISLIEEKFGVQGDVQQAKKILAKPSGSSNFRYWYKELSNEKASAMIRLASKLWGYD
jgi:hypothetical protein